MPETTTGWRSLLSHPKVYDLAQFVLGEKRGRRRLNDRYLKPAPGSSVLDLGCGTAAPLAYMPPDVSYTGYDINEEYIEACRKRYPEQTFHVGSLPEDVQTYDLVLAIAVLHHLSDEEAVELIRTGVDSLKPGGRMVALDPVRTGNRLEDVLYGLDRGGAIRWLPEYVKLAECAGVRVIDAVADSAITPLWIPYTHSILTLGNLQK